jgi:hypothetical protein
MSRPDGFPIMDVSTSIFNDGKFRRLARMHPELLTAGFTVYMAVLADSWGTGTRATIDDAWPPLLPHFDQAVVDALMTVGLLDDEGRVPEGTWEAWYGPAKGRRQDKRDSGRLGGLKSGAGRIEASLQRRSSDAQATLNPSARPSAPTDSTVRQHERNVGEVRMTPEPLGPEWGDFGVEWQKRFGDPPTEDQRAVLWDIVDARPKDAAAWLANAPVGCSPYKAVDHVLTCWRRFKASIPPDPARPDRGEGLSRLPPFDQVLHGKPVQPILTADTAHDSED